MHRGQRRFQRIGCRHGILQLRHIGTEILRREIVCQAHIVEAYPVGIVSSTVAGHIDFQIEHSVVSHPRVDGVCVFRSLVEFILDVAARGRLGVIVGGDGVPVPDEHLVVVGLHVCVGEAVAIVAEADAAGEHRGAVEGLHVHLVETGSESRHLLAHIGLRAGRVLYAVVSVADGRAMYVVHCPSRCVLKHRRIGDAGGLVGCTH